MKHWRVEIFRMHCFVKLSFIIRIFVVFIFSVALFAPVDSVAQDSMWLGIMATAPNKCLPGTMYYDSKLKNLRKASDSTCADWTSIPGNSIYTVFVTVGKNKEADFQYNVHGTACIQEALNSLKDSTQEKRGAVIILPGSYDTGKKALKCIPFVDIIGIDKTSCIITGAGSTVVASANNSGIIGLTIENKNKSAGSVVIESKEISSFAHISACIIKGRGTAINCNKSLSFNINDCVLESHKKNGITLKDSNVTVFNSKVKGKKSGLSCLSSSNACLFNSELNSIYISKDSTVELNDLSTVTDSIKGQKNATIVSENDLAGLIVSDGIITEKPFDASKRRSSYESKRSTSSSSYSKKDYKKKSEKGCGCKKKKNQNFQRITLEHAYELYKKKRDITVFLDVAPKNIYKKKHIKGAINIPCDSIVSSLDKIPKDKTIILYDHRSTGPPQAFRAISLLVEKGFSNIHELLVTLEHWDSRGYPVSKGKFK